MKKLILAAGVILFIGALSITIYFSWPRTQRSLSPTAENKTDQIQHFLPGDWSIGSSKVLVLESIYLPFLHRKFVKTNVRVAQIQGAGVSYHAPRISYTNTRLTRGTVVTLADTGQLLRIVLEGEVPTGPFPGQMTLAKAEDFYQSVGVKYVDLPTGISQLTFQKVMNRIYQHGFAEIEKAGRIEAAYIMQTHATHPGEPPDTSWIVNVYGMPPYPALGNSYAKDDDRSYLRYTVDVRGKVLSADTLP